MVSFCMKQLGVLSGMNKVAHPLVIHWHTQQNLWNPFPRGKEISQNFEDEKYTRGSIRRNLEVKRVSALTDG